MAVHNYLKRQTAGFTVGGSWGASDLMRAYAWPTKLAGGGRIAIIELGGAYLHADTEKFCAANKIPVPSVKQVSVGASPTNMKDEASGEVALDVQVAAAAYSVATGKAADITIIWCADIAAGVRAATAAGFDVCSCSWGADEGLWGMAPLLDMEQACIEATNAGVVFLAASGDNDSSDGGPTPANVDAPASCPHAIGCGGTTRFRDTVIPPAPKEIVWNDTPGGANGDGTGGGFSTVFVPMPLWQAGAPNGPGRMVPDVAGNADPATGWRVWLNGKEEVFGGTSAVAPLYAGLLAACGKKLGWITPKLWLNHLAFTDVVDGDNGMFRARPGPDACTGIGSPIGMRISALLGAMHQA
jgi:subtilase family serine protease